MLENINSWKPREFENTTCGANSEINGRSEFGRLAGCRAVANFVLALGLFLLAIPVIVVVGVLVKLSSSGPAIYKQTRLGKDGRPFSLYKIRTMVDDCESMSGAKWSPVGDPRVTRIGAILRRTHLDELPQLWNILKGEMSLIGPRPERPEFVPTLEKAIPAYRVRLQLRPGVTGLAQVTLPADTDLESVRRKLSYDLYYVFHHEPWLDLRIVVATVLKVFGIPLPALGRVCYLPRGEVVERVILPPERQSGWESVLPGPASSDEEVYDDTQLAISAPNLRVADKL